MSRHAIPMLGRRFGLLTVIRVEERSSTRQVRYLCRCDCGAEVTRDGAGIRQNVRLGNSPNCGRVGCKRPGSGRAKKASAAPGNERVALANYRRIARGFTPAQRASLAKILERHPKAGCANCSRGRACWEVMEAVEAVVLGEKYGLAEPFEESYHRIDYRKAGMYTL